MHPRPARTTAATVAEAGAWAEVLGGYRHLHAALPVPNGQWLVQHRPQAPVLDLDGPAAMVELAAEIQHRTRTTRTRTR
ncbi:hypothetical protein OG427_06965 [Streptomyces sp. NBC_00133]